MEKCGVRGLALSLNCEASKNGHAIPIAFLDLVPYRFANASSGELWVMDRAQFIEAVLDQSSAAVICLANCISMIFTSRQVLVPRTVR
jgi:hypothetical protein